jgi:hypothetical protein
VAFDIPMATRQTPSTTSDRAKKQPSMPPAAKPAASSIARRSPMRSASADAGMSPRTCPMPSSASRKPALVGEAPSSSAVSAMTGAVAPLPISYTMAGRNTDGVMDRSVNGAAVASTPERMIIG